MKQFTPSILFTKLDRYVTLVIARKDVESGKRHFAHDGEISALLEEQALEKELEPYTKSWLNTIWWWKLMYETEELRRETGYGLANVWGEINQANYPAAMKVLASMKQMLGK